MNTMQNQHSDSLSVAKDFFDEQGLTLPFIPSADLPILQLQEGVFSTRSSLMPIYNIIEFVQEILTHPVEDYVMFGFAGHGINSWAMHYYLVKKNLGAFIQLPFGGAMITDEEAVKDRINGTFQSVKYIADSIANASHAHLLSPEKRLIIIESDFYGKGWGWIEGYPGVIDKDQWRTEEPILLNALCSVPAKDLRK